MSIVKKYSIEFLVNVLIFSVVRSVGFFVFKCQCSFAVVVFVYLFSG